MINSPLSRLLGWDFPLLVGGEGVQMAREAKGRGAAVSSLKNLPSFLIVSLCAALSDQIPV